MTAQDKPVTCICGHTYTGHPGPDAPSRDYGRRRLDLIRPAIHRMPWPSVTPIHRRAILRARWERLGMVL